jgi:hypothetical protein
MDISHSAPKEAQRGISRCPTYSRLLPLTPSVARTTALFSRTSRSFRPLHRTTTLIFVSSSSCSKSRSLRFVPTVVATETIDSAGDAAPDLSRGGIAECDRFVEEGLVIGGRMLCFLVGAAACRSGPAIRVVHWEGGFECLLSDATASVQRVRVELRVSMGYFEYPK